MSGRRASDGGRRASALGSALALVTGGPGEKRRSSVTQEIRIHENVEWMVGHRYLMSNPCCLRATPELTSDIVHEMEIGQKVLYLGQQEVMRPNGMPCQRGLVQDSQGRSGWMSFHTPSGERLLERNPQPDSWEKGARHCIMFPCYLRAEFDLRSNYICELQPGDEVLVLDLSAAFRPEDGNPCLRAKVHNREGLVGWISCLSPDCKIQLLNPIDMFEVDGKDLAKSNVMNRLTPSSSSGGKFRSAVTQEVSDWPWEVGGKYRVLGDMNIRECKELNSVEVGIIGLGEKVVVKELATIPRGSGSHPAYRAQVRCDSDGQVGWISCEDKSGKCLLDVRDCLEYDKVQRRLALADRAAREEEERKRKEEEIRVKEKAAIEELKEASKRAEAYIRNSLTEATAFTFDPSLLQEHQKVAQAEDPSDADTSTSAREEVERVRQEYGFDRYKGQAPEDGNNSGSEEGDEKDFDKRPPLPKVATGPRKHDWCTWGLRCCAGNNVQPEGKELGLPPAPAWNGQV